MPWTEIIAIWNGDHCFICLFVLLFIVLIYKTPHFNFRSQMLLKKWRNRPKHVSDVWLLLKLLVHMFSQQVQRDDDITAVCVCVCVFTLSQGALQLARCSKLRGSADRGGGHDQRLLPWLLPGKTHAPHSDGQQKWTWAEHVSPQTEGDFILVMDF